MIPTLILIGLVVGLLPRPEDRLGILVAGAAWPLLRGTSGAAEIDGQSMVAEFAISAINAAVGAVVARLLANLTILARG
jgi:hypothetical protein